MSCNLKIPGFLLCAALCFSLAPIAGNAQDSWKPESNVEIVVGTGAGSSPDKVARLIQTIWRDQRTLDVAATVVNKPGGNNSIGWTYLNQQGHDGHHLMIGVINLSLAYLTGVTPLSYRDITPVSLLFNEYTALVVHPDSAVKTSRELVERLKKDPNAVSLGVSTAAGGANHLAIAMVLAAAGVDVKRIRTVVFNSGGAAVTALLGGHVDMISLSPSVVIPHLKAGRLRALATMSPQRLSGPYADVPTFRELGVKPVFAKYRSIIGPKDMKPEQVAFWESRFKQLSENSEWKKVLNANEWDGQYMNGSELKAFMEEMHKEAADALSKLGMMKSR